ncbi:MAG: S-layer homology domain-containing protein [Anaerovoracaceae bacterium]|jgi:hypothetical protein
MDNLRRLRTSRILAVVLSIALILGTITTVPVSAADETVSTNAVTATLTMSGDTVVTEDEAVANGITFEITPPSGYTFNTTSMTWADGTTPVGANITFTPEYTTTLSSDNQGYVQTALAAATATVTSDKLTVTVPKFNSAFTNYVGGTSSGDITITVALADSAVSLSQNGSVVDADVTLDNNTITIQEMKATVYVVDGDGNKVDLTETDIMNGEERYIVIEQQGNAGGSYTWTLYPGSNGFGRRGRVAVNCFATNVDDAANENDAGTAWEKIEDYWCEIDDSLEFPSSDITHERYNSQTWLYCVSDAGSTLKFKVPQIEDFSIDGDTTIYTRLLTGMVGGTGGGGGNPTVTPYWGQDGRCSFTIVDDYDESKLNTITKFEVTPRSGTALEDLLTQNVVFGKYEFALAYPATVSATYTTPEGETVTADLATNASLNNSNYWTVEPAYDQYYPGTYVFTFKYSTGEYKLADGVSPPQITVNVNKGYVRSLDSMTTEYRVAQGTSEEEVLDLLPDTLSGKAGDVSSTRSYPVTQGIPVTWTIDKEYDANADPGTVYTFTGSLDPDLFVLDGVTIPEIKVTITENKEVVSYTDPEIYESNQLVPIGTEKEDLNIPATLEAVANGKEQDLDVTWESDPEYDPQKAGVYTFSPVLPDGYSWADGVEAPTLQVEVRKPDISIGTTEELKSFLNTAADDNYRGKLVVLTADIDMADVRVTGIDFCGTFDGQGHRVYNLSATGSNAFFTNLGDQFRSVGARNVEEATLRNTIFEGGNAAIRSASGSVSVIGSVTGTVDRCAVIWDCYNSDSEGAIANNGAYGSIINSYAVFNMHINEGGFVFQLGGFVTRVWGSMKFANSYIIQNTVNELNSSGSADPITGWAQATCYIDNTYCLQGAIPGVTTLSNGGEMLSNKAAFADTFMVYKLNEGSDTSPWRWDSTGENGYAPVLKFESNASNKSVETDTLYSITSNLEAENDDGRGVVLDLDHRVQAEAGETITVKANTYNTNYHVSGLKVETNGGESVDVTEVSNDGHTATYEFTMPAHSVNISATVEDDDVVYYIDTADDWQQFVDSVNSGHDYTGETVTVTADNLNLKDLTDLQPAGTEEHPFNGKLVGETSSTNIRSYTFNLPDQDNVGLIGVLGPEGSIENLTISSATVTGKDNVGALVGLCYGSVSGIKLSSTVKATGENNVGALIGLCHGNVSGITANSKTAAAGENNVGVVIGHIEAADSDITIDDITVSSGCTVTGTGNVGVVFGSANGTEDHKISIDEVISRSPISDSSASNVGGIVGELEYAELQNVINYGTSTSYQKSKVNTTGATAGGVVGTMKTGSLVHNAIATYPQENGDKFVSAAENAGGIAGVMEDGAEIDSCFAYYSIEAGSYAGGLVGNAQEGSKITNCFAYNDDVEAGTGSAGAVTGGADATVTDTVYFDRMTVNGGSVTEFGDAVTSFEIIGGGSIYDNLDDSWDTTVSRLPNFGTFVAVPSYMSLSIDKRTIETPEDLYNLALSVATGVNYTGETFTLENDLDMSDVDMFPIGTTSKSFSGSFEGNGHTISNLNYDKNYGYSGLFGYVTVRSGNDVVIENLTLDNVKLESNSTSAGALVGYCLGSSTGSLQYKNITVKNVTIYDDEDGNSTGAPYAGGMVGNCVTPSGLVMENCTAENIDITIDDSTESTGIYGGLAGQIDSWYGSGTVPTISGCSVSDVNISLGEDVSFRAIGGLFGICDGGSKAATPVEMSDCHVDGAVIEATVNETPKTGMWNYQVGGLVGGGDKYLNISDSSANADIVIHNGTSGLSSARGIGGIIGTSILLQNINGCCFTGSIKSELPTVGGIMGVAGQNGLQTINNCYVDADISGTTEVGGIVGEAGYTFGTSAASLENCYVVGSVYASEGCAGGLAGGYEYVDKVTASRIYLTASNCYVLTSSITSGNSSTSDSVGVFSALPTANNSLDNCYYFDKLYVNASDTAKTTLAQSSAGTVTADQALTAATYSDNGWSTPWVLEDGKLPHFEGTEVETPVYFYGGEITAIEALDEDVAEQNVPLGEALGTVANLPTSLTGTVDGEEVSIPVTWICSPDYDTETEGTYKLTPQLSSSMTLADGVELPTITVTSLPVYTATFTVEPDTATVTVKDSDGNVMDANDDGTYSLLKGTYTFTAEADGYISKTGTLDLTQDKAVTITLSKEGSIIDNGSVVISDTNKVTVDSDISNGTVSVSPENAKAGDTVTITPVPDNGYQTGTVTVKTSDGETVEVTENNGTYTFTMPDDGVTVSVTFDKKGLPFTDVEEGSWYYDSVDYVYWNDMMVGTSDTLFSPDMDLTRGMLVTILWRLEGSPSAGSDAIEFSDVDSSQWYADAVAWASSEDIVAGYDSEHFGPEDNITREQMAAIMYRYATFKGYDTSETADLTSFSDYDQISSYALESMSWANATGLLQGMGDNQISPQTGATRAQVAAVITRFCDKYN